jgi:hypothetical protein
VPLTGIAKKEDPLKHLSITKTGSRFSGWFLQETEPDQQATRLGIAADILFYPDRLLLFSFLGMDSAANLSLTLLTQSKKSKLREGRFHAHQNKHSFCLGLPIFVI